MSIYKENKYMPKIIEKYIMTTRDNKMLLEYVEYSTI